MLIDVESGNALDVRGASTVPDTPIIAVPMSGNTNQMWKYSTLILFVSINYIHVLESLALHISTIKFHQCKSTYNLLVDARAKDGR